MRQSVKIFTSNTALTLTAHVGGDIFTQGSRILRCQDRNRNLQAPH